MKKHLAAWSLAALATLNLFGTAIAQDRPNDLGSGVVGVQIGEGPQASTRYLKLEYRLRMLAHYTNQGLIVAQVFPGGPATKLVRADNKDITASLEPGDLVTHVDGKTVYSQNDYYLAMYQSGARGGRVTIRVRDVNSGQFIDWLAVAEPTSGARTTIRKDARTATKVKALLIATTFDKAIGDGATKNILAMESYVRGLPNFSSSDLVLITGNDVSARNIINAVRRLQVEPTEALLCYVASHGAHDPKLAEGDPSGGHFFQFNPDLMRKALLSELQDRGAQLTVLITDTCNVPGDFREPPTVGSPMVIPVESKTFKSLMFDYTGTIDVSGSASGQYGWYFPDGGWFTTGLVGTLRQCDAGGDIDWKGFLDKTSGNVSMIFQSRKKAIMAAPAPTEEGRKRVREQLERQGDQRPQTFQLNIAPVQR